MLIFEFICDIYLPGCMAECVFLPNLMQNGLYIISQHI